jgi:hypothetical protein
VKASLPTLALAVSTAQAASKASGLSAPADGESPVALSSADQAARRAFGFRFSLSYIYFF